MTATVHHPDESHLPVSKSLSVGNFYLLNIYSEPPSLQAKKTKFQETFTLDHNTMESVRKIFLMGELIEQSSGFHHFRMFLH